MTDDLCEVVVTAPDAEWLADLARDLIEGRLCASANILTRVRSIYLWGGATQDTSEARAFLRSRRSHVSSIIRVVTERHPYELPSVAVLPIVDGNPAYLDWVRNATS